MTNIEVINALVEECVVQAQSGVWYLEPLWSYSSHCSEYDGDRGELEEILKLTVKKRNAQENQLMPVLEWLHKLMTETVDPLIDEQQAKLMNDMLAYMQLSDKEKKRKIDFGGWSFAKK